MSKFNAMAKEMPTRTAEQTKASAALSLATLKRIQEEGEEVVHMRIKYLCGHTHMAVIISDAADMQESIRAEHERVCDVCEQMAHAIG